MAQVGHLGCSEPIADWWEDRQPATDIEGWNTTYSLYLYNARAEQYISEHPVNTPMFFYFASQNIHDPHQVCLGAIVPHLCPSFLLVKISSTS